jgi:hypothetical protein
MQIKEEYTEEELAELFDELLDLDVDFNELPDEITILELVQMSNRLRERNE